MSTFNPLRSVSAATLTVLACRLAAAQPQPEPSPVRFTLSREHAVRTEVTLPGTVQARIVSLVASEVDGLVVELAAREGQSVRKGEPLVQLRRDHLELRLEAAQAQRREAQARLKQADGRYQRSQELFASQVLSQDQLDESLYEFQAWQSRIEQLSAEIEQIQLDIRRSTVAAPADGVVVAEHTEIGEWVSQGDPVMEVISTRDLEIRVEVPEQYFPSIRPGAEAKVRFESLPGELIQGRVSSVIPSANPQARTFPLKVRISSQAGRIGAGMLAQVSFPTGRIYRATVVPKDALITRGEQRFVYTLNGNGKVDQVAVETGAGMGNWVEVQKGLGPGVKVVTRGNERLMPGQQVRGRPLEYAPP